MDQITPLIGFGLGVIGTSLFIMMPLILIMRSIHRSEREELTLEARTLRGKLKGREARELELTTTVQTLQKECGTAKDALQKEQAELQETQEKLTRLETLEQEHQKLLQQAEELRIKAEQINRENFTLKEDLRNELFKRSMAEEKLFRLVVMENENQNLRHENLDLKTKIARLDYQEKDLQELKTYHQRTFPENDDLQQERFANSILEMKSTLERTFEAFNKTASLLGQRRLFLLTPQPVTNQANPESKEKIEDISPVDSGERGEK